MLTSEPECRGTGGGDAKHAAFTCSPYAAHSRPRFVRYRLARICFLGDVPLYTNECRERTAETPLKSARGHNLFPAPEFSRSDSISRIRRIVCQFASSFEAWGNMTRLNVQTTRRFKFKSRGNRGIRRIRELQVVSPQAPRFLLDNAPSLGVKLLAIKKSERSL